jgi:hypothetical protein
MQCKLDQILLTKQKKQSAIANRSNVVLKHSQHHF